MLQTTVQDWPGRLGYWHVGVPPIGPDGRPVVPARQPRARQRRGRRRARVHVAGPDAALRRGHRRSCVTGAPMPRRRVDGRAVPAWQPVDGARRAASLDVGARRGPGPADLRRWSAGGLDVPRLPRQRGDVHARPLRRPRRAGRCARATCCDRRRAGRRRRRRAIPSTEHARRSRGDWELARPRGPARGAGVLHRATTSTRSTPPTARCTSTRPAPASG